jgi:hypothetical protein
MFIKRIFIKFILLLFITFVFTSCYFFPSNSVDYFKKELPRKNPTVYIFNRTLQQVKTAIEKVQYSFDLNVDLLKRGDEYLPDEQFIYDGVFEDSSNYDDYILTHQARAICKSDLYVSEEDSVGMDYIASFHLHLTKIDSNRTMVQVITYNPAIINGNHNIALIGMNPGAILEPVEPTSIEEYQILLRIGKKLGVKLKMPKLLLPE